MRLYKASELLKAKYTRRWKGPDGKWRYEYGTPPEKGGQAKAEIARKEKQGKKAPGKLFDEAYADKRSEPKGAAYDAQKEAIIDAFMDGSMKGEDRLQSYARSFGQKAAKKMANDLLETGALSSMGHKAALRAVESAPQISPAKKEDAMDIVAGTLHDNGKLERELIEKHGKEGAKQALYAVIDEMAVDDPDSYDKREVKRMRNHADSVIEDAS